MHTDRSFPDCVKKKSKNKKRRNAESLEVSRIGSVSNAEAKWIHTETPFPPSPSSLRPIGSREEGLSCNEGIIPRLIPADDDVTCGYVDEFEFRPVLASASHFARKYKRQIACALHFHHDCTRGRSQAAALATIAALGENMEAVCTPGSGPNKDYLRGVKCMNYVGDKLHTCFANLKSAVQRAVFKAPAKEALHYTCCAYHDVTECISQTLAPCHRVGATEFLVGIMERVVGTALRPACATHTKGSDACKALKPLAQLGAKDFVVDSLIELLAEAGSTIGRRP
ncbi:uncharacterized protein LOC119459571 isoform X1 [Dermacentor silvarum]|uniref:uncharacterized protein LOC119459571 isoform X1 n=1 Tax=Dermacentor silvarum TaxID=543639 RepID=UPI00210074B8|nr:uncharacterized protein LOC119459571 isoform X1 [Dermacentor silvarum]